MRDDGHVLGPDGVLAREKPNEAIGIADKASKALGVAALARRTAVAARIPREDREVIETEQIHHFLEPGGVFVAAMEQHDCAAGWFGAQPRAIEDPRAIPSGIFMLRAPPRSLTRQRCRWNHQASLLSCSTRLAIRTIRRITVIPLPIPITISAQAGRCLARRWRRRCNRRSSPPSFAACPWARKSPAAVPGSRRKPGHKR